MLTAQRVFKKGDPEATLLVQLLLKAGLSVPRRYPKFPQSTNATLELHDTTSMNTIFSTLQSDLFIYAQHGTIQSK